MNKKYLRIFAVLAVAAIAAWNVNFNSRKSNFSDVMLANLEALANGEDSDMGSICYNTYNLCWFFDCEHIWSCSDCNEVKCDSKSNKGTCSVSK